MKFSIYSLLTVLGLFLSMLAVESADADCFEAAEASVEHAVQPGGTEGAETDRTEVGKITSSTMQKAAVEPLGLEQLVARLKKTEAIGFFTKLAIRSDVFDFQASVESYRRKKMFKENVEMLRDRFNGLLLKILTLLDSDPALSRDIHLARDSIWRSLVEVKS